MNTEPKKGEKALNDTPNEEVLSVMVERMANLTKKNVNRKYSFVLQKIEEALMWLRHGAECQAEIKQTTDDAAPVKAKRGRRSKAKIMNEEKQEDKTIIHTDQPKRRGRPPKQKVEAIHSMPAPPEQTPKKRRGRPPKNPAASSSGSLETIMRNYNK